jgi:hypothetical protein
MEGNGKTWEAFESFLWYFMTERIISLFGARLILKKAFFHYAKSRENYLGELWFEEELSYFEDV